MEKAGRSKIIVTPFDYGLSQARSGEERYWVLYNTHVAAAANGCRVDYSGIKCLDLEIPKDAKSIPLTELNDFKGVEFRVKNTQKHFFLFSYSSKSSPIKVEKRDIDKGNFKKYPQLAKGHVLLSVADDKPWVLNREGYRYGHVRKDILLLNNGMAQNKPIMPYNNDYSSPSCKFYVLQNGNMKVSNVILSRSENSTFRTYLVSLSGIDGISFENVTINTPENKGENDVAISIKESTNVTLKNVRINGTYSRSDHSGYGVSLNNIWNFKVSNMYAYGNWGVFGTNNVNTASFENCDINRFDIHCYGRDIKFKNVTFRNKYNQFASVFGTIRFDNCTFINFCPVLNGTSYNAYVGYNIVLNNCLFYIRKGKNILIDQGRIDDKVNARQELSNRCIPNISIKNLKVIVPIEVSNIYLFYFRGKEPIKRSVDYLSEISISGVSFVYSDERALANFYLSNLPLRITKDMNITLKDIDLISKTTVEKKGYGKFVKNLNLVSKKSVVRESNIKANYVD